MQRTRRNLVVRQKTECNLLKIIEEKVNSFIELLKKYELNEIEIITATVDFLIKIYRESHPDVQLFSYKTIRNIEDVSSENIKPYMKGMKIDNLFQEKICSYDDVKKSFLGLCQIYLIPNVFENPSQLVRTQTCIRELFHMHLNPLPLLQMPNIKNNDVIPFSKASIAIDEDDLFFHHPAEIQNNILSYVDYKSMVLFGQTCKSGYLHYKQRQNYLYLIGNPIEITRPREIGEAVIHDPRFHDKISDDDLVESLFCPVKESLESFLPSADKSTEMYYAFPSLYHAIECAHLFKTIHFNGFSEENIVRMPTIWVVSYRGNHAFENEMITINPRICGAPSTNQLERKAYVTSIKIPKQDIQLHIGTALCLRDHFATYRVFNILDFTQYRQKKQEEKESSVLSQMSHCRMM